MNEDIYDQAAEQLEQELRWQYPDVRWRVPKIVDYLFLEDGGMAEVLEGFRLRVVARRGQYGGQIEASGHFVDDNPALAARLIGEQAIRLMDRATRSIDVDATTL
jgi:hypothetical protein